MSESPIFLVGCPGSGTSLLRDLLRSHPRLVFPGESHFIPTFYRAFGDPRSDRAARALAARLLRLVWVRAWALELDPGSLAHCRSYGEVLSGIYGELARASGKERWGDKTPSYVEEIPLLLELYPAARVVHIVRDGRDVAASWTRKPFGPGNMVAAASSWERMVTAGRRAGTASPSSYLEIRYERLLARPADTMKEVCSFIGEDFDNAVLRPTRRDRPPPRPLIGARPLPPRASESEIAPANASKWRQTMSAQDRAAFDQVAGHLLTELRYEPGGGSPTMGVSRRRALELSGSARRRVRLRNRTDISPATFVLMREAQLRSKVRALARGVPSMAHDFFGDPVGHTRARGRGLASLELLSPSGRFLVVRDPDAIWRVLVTDAAWFRPGKWKRRASRLVGPALNTLDGSAHRERRLLLQPPLDPRRVATFAPAVVAHARSAQAAWADGDTVRLRDDLDRYALTVAGEVLLSTDLEPWSEDLAGALRAVMRAVHGITPPVLGTPGGQALRRADRMIGEIVARRRRDGSPQDDLVGALLSSGLPEHTIRGEILAFLLATADEPTSALEAAWYLLGRHPEAEAKLHEELDTVVGSRPPDAGSARRLVYQDAVLSETLRLYPPARHIDRCPVADLRIGAVKVPAGSNVVVSPLVAHHEPCFYERADEFVPERWLTAGAREHPRGAYIPFGAGAHACIGQPLARSIMTFGLSTIGSRWRLRIDADAPAPSPRAPRLEVTLERRR